MLKQITAAEQKAGTASADVLAAPAAPEPKPTFLEFLLNEDNPWPEDFLPERSRQIETHREVSLA